MTEQGQPPCKPNLVYNEFRTEGKLCDAIIKVDDVEFQVHKLVLCTCTEYFRAMSDITRRPFVPRLYRPRLPHAILLAIGGWSGNGLTNTIEAYDYKANHWVIIKNDLEHPRAHHGTAFLDGYVYSIGGLNRGEYFNSVRRFDPTTLTWQEVAPMYYRRCYVSVTVLNGCIYAIGGYNGHRRLETAERYEPKMNQWTLIAPMHEMRGDASCTTFDNRIYICGGFNGTEYLQTAEYYSPETDQWTGICPMNSCRSRVGVIAYADRIFAVGGFDGTTRLQTAEAYNPQMNSWNLVPSMLTPHSSFGIEVIDHRLFVVGGLTKNVEYYNALTDEWSRAGHTNMFRTALSCCVVSGLSNLTDYIMPRPETLAKPRRRRRRRPMEFI